MFGKMFRRQGPSVPSPARPTGVLSEALEVPPKPNGRVGQDTNSKLSLPQLSRNNVVTDAVPSPARPRETVDTEPEQKKQREQNFNFPPKSPPNSPPKSPPKSRPKSPPKTDLPREPENQNESERSSGFSSRRKTSYEPGALNVINIVNSKGFSIGPTFHQYIVKDINNQYEEDKKKTKIRKQCKKLLSSQDELLKEDIIIVSESLSDEGLTSLLRELPMDEGEADLIKKEFGYKGLSEVIFQILTRWKCLKRPSLGSLSSKLLPEDVYQNGGRRALKGLHALHSSND